jgi:hypothetical protein
VTGAVTGVAAGTLPTVTGGVTTLPASTLPGVGGTGGGVSARTLPVVGVTVAGAPPVSGSRRPGTGAAGGPSAGSTPGAGTPHVSRVSQATMPSGPIEAGTVTRTGMSAGAGGGSPGWPGLPYGNPGPLAVGGTAAGQSAASGSGHGGSGPVAALAASLLITIVVLRIRRTKPLRPRSAWLSAFEVPG